MRQALIDWLKANGGKHAEALVIAGALVFGGRMYLQEHDARLRADTAVKTAEENVKALTAQQATVQHDVQTKVVILRDKAAEVNTAEKAIAAIPETAPELKAVPLPDAPDMVAVKAVPLFKELNQGQQCALELQGCQESLALQKQIDAEKDKEVKAEQRKPGFLHRLGKGLKVIGCAAGGAAVGGLAKSPTGAAIGAAAGAGVCQMF
jgi:hypothetical protein